MHDFIKKLTFFLQNKKILIPLHPLYDKIKQVLNGNRGVAQLVSASALGAEGPPFESEYPDKKELYESVAPFLLYTIAAISCRATKKGNSLSNHPFCIIWSQLYRALLFDLDYCLGDVDEEVSNMLILRNKIHVVNTCEV